MAGNEQQQTKRQHTETQVETLVDSVVEQQRHKSVRVESAVLRLDTAGVDRPSTAEETYRFIHQLIRHLDALESDDDDASLLEADILRLFIQLRNMFSNVVEDELRAKIASAFRQLFRAAPTTFRWQLVWNDLASMLREDRSSKVQYQLLLAVVEIWNGSGSDDQILAVLLRQLCSSMIARSQARHFQVMQLCMELLGKTRQCALDPARGISENVLDAWRRLRAHYDPRQRLAAYATLLQLVADAVQGSAPPPPPSVYEELMRGGCFRDASHEIRRLCIHVVFGFAKLYPNATLGGDSTKRLADDAFARICDCCNDAEISVRLEAITMLPMCSFVDEQYLLQTLDKKIMKHTQARLSQAAADSEWSTGRRWAAKSGQAPRGDVNAESISLMSMGACGAFIHALEDEFKCVRAAALDSMVLVAERSPAFAEKSVDFCIDMLNDEIENVRLKAIRTLARLGAQIKPLSTEQLEIIVAVLQESSGAIRHALMSTIATLPYQSSDCIRMVLDATLKNLERNANDMESACTSLKKMGRHHRHFMLAPELINQLLQRHPFLKTPEPSVDDRNYICTLVLVCNAAEREPSIIDAFPPHLRRHYSYMRYQHRNWIPCLPSLEGDADSGVFTSDDRADAAVERQMRAELQSIVKQLRSAFQAGGSDLPHKRLQFALADVRRMAELEAPVDCQSLVLFMRDLLESVSVAAAASRFRTSSGGQVEAARVSRMLATYSGLSNQEVYKLRELRLLLTLQRRSAGDSDHHVRQRVEAESLRSFIRARQIDDLTPLGAALSAADTSDSGALLALLSKEAAAAPLPRSLGSLLFCPSERFSRRRVDSLELLDSSGGSVFDKKSLEFFDSLALRVRVRARLRACPSDECVRRVRIRVAYPDSTRVVVPLSDSSVTVESDDDDEELQEGAVTISHQVYLWHSSWSDRAAAEICIVYDLRDEAAGEEDRLQTSGDDVFVPISETKTLNLYPRR